MQSFEPNYLWGDIEEAEFALGEIYEAFDIQSREAPFGGTVGDVFEIVKERLPADGAQNIGCASAICFYRLRKALQPLVPGIKLRPDTPMSAFGQGDARKLYRIIEKHAGLHSHGPGWSGLTGLALGAIFVFPVIIGGFNAAIRLPWWANLALFLLPIIVFTISPRRIQGNLETFGDLVREVASCSAARLSESGARLTEREAWNTLLDILAYRSQVPRTAITPDLLLLCPGCAPD